MASNKLIVFMTMSLDGFIAAEHDAFGAGLGVGGEALHAWLGAGPDGVHPAPGADADELAEMMSTGAVIIGRRSSDNVAGFEGDHHDGVPIFILTRHPEGREPFGNARYVGDPAEAAALAKEAAGDRDVMMHGGSAAQALLDAGVVDELSITLAPMVLGHGLRLFPDPSAEHDLTLVRAVQGAGALHLR
jgi:dihydrofolate reductase